MRLKDRAIENLKLDEIQQSEALIFDTIKIPESGFYKIFDIGRGGVGGRPRLRGEREVYSRQEQGETIHIGDGNDCGDAMQFGCEVVKLTFKSAKITIDRVVLKSKKK